MSKISENSEAKRQLAATERWLHAKLPDLVNRVYSGELGQMIEIDDVEVIETSVGFASYGYDSFKTWFSAGASCSATISSLSKEEYTILFDRYKHNISDVEIEQRKVNISGHVDIVLNTDESDVDKFGSYYRHTTGDSGEWKTANFFPPGYLTKPKLITGFDSFWNISDDEGLLTLYLQSNDTVDICTNDVAKFTLWLAMLEKDKPSYYIKEDSFEGFSAGTQNPARFSRIINKKY